MLLNPYNCFLIKGFGLYVYISEINKLYFYKENDVEFIYTDGFFSETIKGENAILLQKEGSTEKLYLKPFFFGIDQYKQYFRRQKNKKIIDFFLMKYTTEKKNRLGLRLISNSEYKIVAISWENKSIKYYGEGKLPPLQIYDIYVPSPDEFYILPELKSLEYYRTNKEFKTFIDIILGQFRKNPLQNPMDRNGFNPELETYLLNLGLLNSNMEKGKSIEALFNALDSSEFKESWKKTAETYFAQYVVEPDKKNPLIHGDIGGYQIINRKYYLETNNEAGTKYYKFQPESEASKNTSQLLNHISVKINNNIIDIPITLDELIGEGKKCGADNCFKTVAIGGKRYGIRFGQHILLDKTIYLYDAFVEMLINCLTFFTYEKKSKEIPDIPSCDIQPIHSLGFYKIQIDEQKKEYGYIPYTVYEIQSDTTLYDFLIQILNSEPEEYPTDRIKKILHDVSAQVYNFYRLMYLSVKFEHNDFKIDNIIIDTRTLKTTIIDFGFSRVEAMLDSRKFKLFKRDVKEIQKESRQSSFIDYVSDIYRYYLNRQADIERFTVWLKEISKPEPGKPPFKNQSNYDVVIKEHFIPNVKYLDKLTLDDLRQSNEFSRYREQEIQHPENFTDCGDLFLFSLQELYDCILSIEGIEKRNNNRNNKSKCSQRLVIQKGGYRNKTKKIQNKRQNKRHIKIKNKTNKKQKTKTLNNF